MRWEATGDNRSRVQSPSSWNFFSQLWTFNTVWQKSILVTSVRADTGCTVISLLSHLCCFESGEVTRIHARLWNHTHTHTHKEPKSAVTPQLDLYAETPCGYSVKWETTHAPINVQYSRLTNVMHSEAQSKQGPHGGGSSISNTNYVRLCGWQEDDYETVEQHSICYAHTQTFQYWCEWKWKTSVASKLEQSSRF